MSHIFISYSTQNREYAHVLADKLQAEGFDVWIDKRSLHSSEDWWRSIVLAIRDCAAITVILTPEADSSRWVQREITLAEKYDKKIFPLWLAGELNTPNWELFVRTQIEDVRNGELPRAEFYNYISRSVPRKNRAGNDVTTQAQSAIRDPEVVREIANPPSPDTLLSPSSTRPHRANNPRMYIVTGVIAIIGLIGVILFVNREQVPSLINLPTSTRVIVLTPTELLSSTLSPTPIPSISAAARTPNTVDRTVTAFSLTPLIATHTSTPNETPTSTFTNTIPPNLPRADISQITFYSNRSGNSEIYVSDADGKNLRQLTFNPFEDGGSDWSPDNKEIVFHSNRSGNYDIYVINIDGSNVRRLTTTRANNIYPVWSPDGKQIAFFSNLDGNNDIYVMDADGSNQRNLTKDSPTAELSPSWSPDSSQIAFRSDRDGNAEIYVMNADGSNPYNLTKNPAGDATPAWSPTGKEMLFSSNRDGNNEIYIMDMNSRQTRRLTQNGGTDSGPDWSPDGKQIVFVSNVDGNSEIYVMDANGDNQKNITNNIGYDNSPRWSPLMSMLNPVFALPTVNPVAQVTQAAIVTETQSVVQKTQAVMKTATDLASVKVRITFNGAAIQSGPSAGLGTLGSLKLDEIIIIDKISTNKAWVHIPSRGWVSADLIEVIQGSLSSLPIGNQ